MTSAGTFSGPNPLGVGLSARQHPGRLAALAPVLQPGTTGGRLCAPPARSPSRSFRPGPPPLAAPSLPSFWRRPLSPPSSRTSGRSRARPSRADRLTWCLDLDPVPYRSNALSPEPVSPRWFRGEWRVDRQRFLAHDQETQYSVIGALSYLFARSRGEFLSYA